MAFYSVRVDEEGKEIETSRRTFRKMSSVSVEKPSSEGSIRANEHIPPLTNTTANSYKTVRYVNSATFIEKDMKATKKPDVEEDTNDKDKNEDANSVHSSCESEDMADTQYQTHISPDCDTIPLLELNSNESFPSSNNMSYSYRKMCEVSKMIKRPDAYKEWLDAKKTAKCYEKKNKQDKLREEEEKKEQRRTLAQEKYKEWVARKTKQKLEKQVKEVKNIQAPEVPERAQIPSEAEQLAKKSNFEAWLTKKMRREQELKEKLNEEMKLEMQLEQIRRQKAREIYNEWLKTAVEKPKPVPLNRGLLTLKGSISSLYINPVPWVSLDKEGSGTL